MCWGCISQCCKVFVFYDVYSFFLKLLNYSLEKESEKLLITTCISKIGSIESIEVVLNFDQKNWPDFVGERSYLEDLLEEHFSPDDWYFVSSSDTEPANLQQWKFDSLAVIKKET